MKKKLATTFLLILTMLSTTIFASAASNPAVTIVSPSVENYIYSDSLLISVKITRPEKIKVTVYEEKQKVGDKLTSVDVSDLTALEKTTKEKTNFESVTLMKTETFASNNNLSFYTKQINDVKPGLYKVVVNTVEAGDKVTYSSEAVVVVKGKVSEEEKAKIFESSQSGISQFLQNLLKTIFK